MLMEQVTGLDLMQGDDNILEKNDMLFPQWYGEPTNNTG